MISIIDFRAVTGFDLSALDSLKSYVQRAKENGVKPIFSAASDRLKQEVQREFSPALLSTIVWTEDEEQALAEAEDFLIEHHRNQLASDSVAQNELRRDVTPALLKHLDRLVVFEDLITQLRNRLTYLAYADQQPIAFAGEQQSGAQLLVRGKAQVQDGDERRLYECEVGAVIESASAIEPQQARASCIAQGSCETLLVTPEELKRLESENNQLALKLYRYILGANSLTLSRCASR